MKKCQISAWIAVIMQLWAVAAVDAATISEEMARIAAESFIERDSIGSSVLKGVSISAVEKRGNLWLVKLSPSGYILFAGTDLAAPVVAFSKNNFVEPSEDSAFYAVMKGAGEGCAALEAEAKSGGSEKKRSSSLNNVDDSSLIEKRKAKWRELLATQQVERISLSAETRGNLNLKAGEVNISPFLNTKWNQGQPYNDFAPVHNPLNQYDYYRGRTASGCVATAASQVLAYWSWPNRLDDAFAFDHVFSDNLSNDAGKTLFGIRFDGHTSFDWTALNDTYALNGNDWRHSIAESMRYPIARLLLFCDSLSLMHFSIKSGSAGNFYSIANMALPWYEPGRRLSKDDGHDELVSAIRADIQNKVPVLISIPGHAVIGHGWKEEASSRYVYLNYGYSGSNDGYYNIDDISSSSAVSEACIGFTPRKSVSLNPLSSVSAESLTLSWNLPHCYANDVDGFRVEVEKESDVVFDFCEEFEDEDSAAYLGMGNSCVLNGRLRLGVLYSSTFAFRESYALTSGSVLSFKVDSAWALNMNVEVQASFDGGDWITLVRPCVNEQSPSKGERKYSAFIGDRGGSLARFRIVSRTQGAYYPNNSYVDIDDFTITDVKKYNMVKSLSANRDDRFLSVNGLQRGARYKFSIVPLMDGGVLSEPEYTRIEGEYMELLAGEKKYEKIDELLLDLDSTYQWWTVNGEVEDETTIIPTDYWRTGFSCTLPDPIDETSVLAFDWSVNAYYVEGSAYDVITASFEEYDGSSTVFWTVTNTVSRARTSVELPLSGLAGKIGVLTVDYKHIGSQYTGQGNGCKFYNPKIKNVNMLKIPEVMSQQQECQVLPPPEILSVENVKEGFFRECSMGVSVIKVKCSSSTDRLEAIPSHYSLVGNSDVTVAKNGNGDFTVAIKAFNIPGMMERSRMILTLKASDKNNTSTYKDLVLRFSTETASDVYDFDDCVVFFDANGGSLKGSASYRVRSGSGIGILPDPILRGCRFKGWFSSPRGGVQITSDTVINGNVIFYAQWEKIEFSELKFEYEILDDCVKITKYTGEDAVVDIPWTIEGLPVTGIGSFAFYRCESLKDVTIPDGVTDIGSFAFEYCYSLASVSIPDSVTSIGSWAFCCCDSLENIVIPDGVKSIGSGAFDFCGSLAGVVIPGSVESIGSFAFSYCSKMRYFTVDGENKFYKSENGLLLSKDGTVLIACPGGKTSVTIPDSVTSIGDYVFYGCDLLAEITVPDKVTRIGDWAFRSCDLLESVIIPENVTSIGELPFEDCVNLIYVKIPLKLKGQIDEDLDFSGCPESLRIEYYGSAESLTVSASSVSAPSSGRSGTVSVAANCGWTVAKNVSWITVSPTSGSGNGTVSYTVLKNTSASSRTGTITVTSSGGTVRTISVRQEGAPPSPVPPDPTPTPDPTVCTVTFDANGGTVFPNTMSLPVGSWFLDNSYPVPTREGYTFEGWYTSPKGGLIVMVYTRVNADVTYYARWRSKGKQPLRFGVGEASEFGIWGGEVGYVTGVSGLEWNDFNAGHLCTGEGGSVHAVAFRDDRIVDAEKNARKEDADDYWCPLLSDLNLAVWTGWAKQAGYSNEDALADFCRNDPMLFCDYSKGFEAGEGAYGQTGFLKWLSDQTGKNVLGYVDHVTDGSTLSAELEGAFAAGDRMFHLEIWFEDYVWKGMPGVGHAVVCCGYSLDTAKPASDPSRLKALFIIDADNDMYSGAGGSSAPDEIMYCPVTWNERTQTYFVENIFGTTGEITPWCQIYSLRSEKAVSVNRTSDLTPRKGAEGTVPSGGASVYDGYLLDPKASGSVVGTVQAKVAKPKLNKKTGSVTSKVSVSIQLAGGKKVSVKGEIEVDDGMLELRAKDGRLLELGFGEDVLFGSFGGYEIGGSRNLFESKDKTEAAAANAKLQIWGGAVNVYGGGASFSVMLAKKGKVTVKGTMNGVKISAKSQAMIVDDAICIPVVYSKKTVDLAFTIRLAQSGGEAEIVGLSDAVIGRSGVLKKEAEFILGDGILNIPGVILNVSDAAGVQHWIPPSGERVSGSGKKWIVAGGVKAAKIKYDREIGRPVVAPSRKGGEIANASGLKLSYKAKDGTFKGSFTLYTLDGAKLRKEKATVEGVLIEGVGYGSATIRKRGSWPIEIR